MEDKAIGGVSWTFLSYAANRLLTLGTTLVLARLLAPRDFGLLALATLAIGLFGLFRDLGLANAMVMRQDLTRDDQGTVLTLMLGTGAVLAAVIAGTSPLAAALFEEPRLKDLLPVLSLTLVFGALTGFYSSLMQRELGFRNRFWLGMTQVGVYLSLIHI